jgi:hypothetical protein
MMSKNAEEAPQESQGGSLQRYEQIVDWIHVDCLYSYIIQDELDRLNGESSTPREDTVGDDDLEDPIVIALHGQPNTGFAISVTGTGFNVAPRLVFRTKEEAKEEALRLYEWRKNKEYLRMLMLQQFESEFNWLFSQNEEDLPMDLRQDYRRQLAEQARVRREIHECFRVPGKPC